MKKKNLIYNSIENYDNTDVQIAFFEKVINGMHVKFQRARELNLPMKTVEDRLKALEILKKDEEAQRLLEARLKQRLQNQYDADVMVFAGDLDHFLQDVIPIPSFLENSDKADMNHMIYNYSLYLEMVEFDMYEVIKYEMNLNESYLFAAKEQSKLSQCVALSTFVRPSVSIDTYDEKAEYDDFLDALYSKEAEYMLEYKAEAAV